MILTIDIGNSRIKWALWSQAMISVQGAHDYTAKTMSQLLDTAWAELAVPSKVVIACVAGDSVLTAVQDWLAGRWQMSAQVLRTTKHFSGLSHGYAQPSDHGVDRWAAMIAARALYQTPLCIISCGTATTLDVITADGQHLGGQIMPGSELMFSTLRARLPALAEIEYSARLPAALFATNTADAVQQGVVHMAAAGLDRACDAAREMLGVEMKTLITGGAATVMLALMNHSAELQPDLVLHGIYLASQQAAA